MVKDHPANAGDARDGSSIPRLERSPGAGQDNSLQYPHLGNPYGQRSRMGYSPYGHKESDMTEATWYTHR